MAAHLHWRIRSADGILEFAAVPSAKVALVVGKADHFAEISKLSRYRGYLLAYQVSAGKPGGVGPGDGLYPAASEWRP